MFHSILHCAPSSCMGMTCGLIPRLAAHPSCMGMAQQAAVVARSYDWQCLDCKTCQVCGAPDQEEKMVFCDECDRGYHSFCVGLANIPTGKWGQIHVHLG